MHEIACVWGSRYDAVSDLVAIMHFLIWSWQKQKATRVKEREEAFCGVAGSGTHSLGVVCVCHANSGNTIVSRNDEDVVSCQLCVS
jgi:hypothetical protein